MRWAMISGGVVTNIVLWDGVSEWDHGPDELASLDGLDAVGIGWTWDGSAFAPPPPADDGEEA